MITTAVYTHWSGPENRYKDYPNKDMSSLCLWVLSVNFAARIFDKVILFTDAKGKALLVDQMNLPFTEVRVVLDDIVDKAFNHIWCLGKLKTYTLMDEPFIHLDHDVLLWNRLPDRILDAPVCAQSFESLVMGHWRWTWYDTKTLHGLPYTPEFVKKAIGKSDTVSFNAGIYGGTNLDFIHQSAQIALDTLTNPVNRAYFLNNDGTLMSVFLEQYFAANYARDQKVLVEMLLSEDEKIAALQSQRLGYMHYWGKLKRGEKRQEIYNLCKKHFLGMYRLCAKISKEAHEAIHNPTDSV